MIEQTDSKLQELSEYLQYHQEKTSLSLKIKFTTNQQKNIQIIKVIQEELTHLNHLTSLALLILNHTVLTSEGYCILSDAVLNLKKLKKLQIQIDQDCYLENEGLSILQDMINQLPELEYLKLEIRENNYIKAEAVQAFLDSLVVNTQLTTLSLYFQDIQISSISEGNIHFWRGISNLVNLEKLKLSLCTHNYGNSDLIELCALLPNLNKLRRLHLAFYNPYLKDTVFFVELFAQLGKMIELRSLKIYYGLNDFTLNEALRKTIITNLRNLKFLEKLKLNDLQELLLKDNFQEYPNLIRDLKYLRSLYWKINDNQIKSIEQIDSLGQSLLVLKNLTKLEVSIQLENILQWDKFFQDLSVSFSQMPNLLSLKLEFLIVVCQQGNIILGESFGYLQGLEKLELRILNNEENINDLLYGICKVRNLKQLEIIIEGKHLEDEEETALLNSISYLLQLERLHLVKDDYIYLGGFQNLELLRTTLINLRKLKSLKCGIFIQDLDSQNQSEALEKCFQNLFKLEHLQLKFDIEQQNDNLQSKPLISHLINLKTLDIKFPKSYYNIFGSSAAPYFQKLEQCSLRFRMIEAEQLIKILELLSKSTIKVLSLDIETLNDCQIHKESFEMAFLKLSSLEELFFQERESGNLMTYIHGIKQMKQLEKLYLDSNVKEMTLEDLCELDFILKQLKNLQVLDVNLNQYNMFSKDKLSSQSFYNFRVLFPEKVTSFFMDHCNHRYIEVQQVCSLGLTQLNPKKFKNHDKLINFGDLNEITQEFYQAKVIIDLKHTKYEKKSITLSELDFHNLQYLNQCDIKCDFSSEGFVELKLLQPLRDFTSESKLVKINLDLENLIFSEEQIRYFSRNFKFLTNLQQLKYSSNYSKDYYFLLFDSFKYLTNLHEIMMKSRFSEKDAISLGKSLNSMSKLQECQLNFGKESNFEVAGIISIFTGLKEANKLKQLDFEMNSDKIINESSQIPISFSNLKQLHKLNFQLGVNGLNSNSLREFFTSIGSLISLNILDINIKEENPINQEMLDYLIKSLSKLTNLKHYNILIYLENNTNNLGQDFATLFNLNSNNKLNITLSEYEVLFEQNKNCLSLGLQSVENLEVNFLEFLNQNTQVSLEISESKILNNIKRCGVRKVELILNYQRDKEVIDNVCRFMTKIPNIFELGIEAEIDEDLDQEEFLILIAQSLTQLKTVKVLNLKFYGEYHMKIDCAKLTTMLNILKTMEQLQQVSLKTTADEVHEKIIPKILRVFPRLVISQLIQSFDEEY